ncbi:tRNA threonylcarbamoyladenosine dehydratase [Caproiciproducens sp. R2]|uniref:tRNA threonylcarbamoyladenosine dehydratase n=1 Tax=Caproiciproducens sp. R2 TaxID=3435187 RepID=UPI004034D0F3
MLNEFSRTELLLGAPAMKKLQEAAVAVFGIGGVGSYTAEALARSGIGGIALFDDDKVCLTNINRQLIATRKTVGRAKVEVMRDRILEINPSAKVEIFPMFYTAENADTVDLSRYSYVVDAIDTISAKLILIERAKAAGVPVISCMGAGNKLDPTKFEVADIYQTSVCPLARVMRNELRKRNIPSLKVVYSKEPPMTPIDDDATSCKYHCICPPGTKRKCSIRRQVPGSVSFVPSVAGLILAGEVIKDIVRE